MTNFPGWDVVDPAYDPDVMSGEPDAAWTLAEEAVWKAGRSKRDNFADLVPYIERSLPPVPDGYVRLWRGNRTGEQDSGNPSYSNSLDGIALPFRQSYGGSLTYVDVPQADFGVDVRDVTGGFEFVLPDRLVRQVRVVPPPIVVRGKGRLVR